jgi:toxin-antitoxin system PIN domain toxin
MVPPPPKRALLDVNVLIALLDGSHVSHRAAMAWLAQHGRAGWASCPTMQNGCVRVMSSPGYPAPRPAWEVAERLRGATMDAAHEFWPDAVSVLDPAVVQLDRIHGARQLTEAYLLALAVRQGGAGDVRTGRAVAGGARGHGRAPGGAVGQRARRRLGAGALPP